MNIITEKQLFFNLVIHMSKLLYIQPNRIERRKENDWGYKWSLITLLIGCFSKTACSVYGIDGRGGVICWTEQRSQLFIISYDLGQIVDIENILINIHCDWGSTCTAGVSDTLKCFQVTANYLCDGSKLCPL